jgi:hypothetical protein
LESCDVVSGRKTRGGPLDSGHGAHPPRRPPTILGDLAAVQAAQRHPDAACGYAEQALQQLAITWYATGMHRILEVRKTLQPWAEDDCVQALDDQLYGWQATLSTLQR